MTFGFARKFISRLESFLPIDPNAALKSIRYIKLSIITESLINFNNDVFMKTKWPESPQPALKKNRLENRQPIWK